MNRAVLDSLESGLIWFDAERRIVDVNRAARETLGLGDRHVGARIEDLGWAQSDEQGTAMPEHARPLRRALDGDGATTSGVVVVDTAERGKRWLRIRAVPV